MSRVLVAMSGGVDSALAAALLVEDGHDVVGVHLRLADVAGDEQVQGQGCCTLDDAQDARRTAQQLGVPFYVWDLSERFHRDVQAPFAAGWRAGQTPNPCVACNERVKYRGLLERARQLGFDALATGHHARLRRGGRHGDGVAAGNLEPVRGPGPGVRLFRAVDDAKDQSYVLHMASPGDLAHSLFPVGELTKDEVRRGAAARGLARVAAKPDSYDICFVPDGDTAGWLDERLDPRPGPVVDLDGTVLGQHRGTWHVTVGQRRGLGLSHHRRRFVVDVDATTDTVVVGAREALACRWVRVDHWRWVAGSAPAAEVALQAQVRAHGAAVGAVLDGSTARLDRPLHGVATGQSVALYAGAECLGGGTIVEADRPEWVRPAPGAVPAGR